MTALETAVYVIPAEEHGALDPAGGALRPDPDRPGHGLTHRHADTEHYRPG